MAGALEVPAWDMRVGRAFVAAFVAERLSNIQEEQRSLKDKIGKRFDTAVKNGRPPVDANGRATFDEIVRWIHTVPAWAPVVAGLLPPTHATANMTLPPLQMAARLIQLPQSVEESNQALARCLTDRSRLEQENAALQHEVERLRPLEAKRHAQSAKQRIAGQRGGRPRKS